MVARSRSVLNQVTSPSHAILAATLALEAKELIGNRTPTLAFQALSLQYESEVHAECLFLGIDQNIDISLRLAELKIETERIGKTIDKQSREQAIINARLAISDSIAQRFRSHGQIEEVLQSEQESRMLRSRFYFSQKVNEELTKFRDKVLPWINQKVKGCIFIYGAYLLSNIWRYCGMCVFWILIFAFRFSIQGVDSDSGWIIDSAHNFFTFSQTDQLKVLISSSLWLRVLVLLQILLGITHLGIFLSHLYIRISRH